MLMSQFSFYERYYWLLLKLLKNNNKSIIIKKNYKYVSNYTCNIKNNDLEIYFRVIMDK